MTNSPKNSKQAGILARLGKLNLFGITLALLLLVGLVFILDSGPLVDWVFQNRQSKLDELLFVALLLVLAVALLSLRRVFTIPTPHEEPAAQLSTTTVKQHFLRDLIVLALLLGCSTILVFLFDTGSLVEWLASTKAQKSMKSSLPRLYSWSV